MGISKNKILLLITFNKLHRIHLIISMKVPIATILMIFLVNLQFMDASPMPAPKEPLQKSQYQKCKVVWKTINKAGYKEVKEEKCETIYVKKAYKDTKTECTPSYKEICESRWVCLDYPKQENLDNCQNKKWQETEDGCKSIHVDVCKDVPITIYENVPEQKCRTIHKQVPTQIKRKVAFRECPGRPTYEFTSAEVKEFDLTDDSSNEIQCELDPDLCDSSKPSNPPKSTSNNSCQCSGHLSETHTGLKIGECNSKNQNEGEGRFFCYIEATNSKCCEAESSKYTKYCLNYSICEDTKNAPKAVPSKGSS